MAKVPPKKKGKSLFDEQPQSKGDFAALVESIKANPGLYAAGIAFLFIVFLAGVIYRGYALASEKDLVTRYATALEEYEPAKLVAALEPLAYKRGKVGGEITYVYGEAALRAQQFDKAKEAFESVRKNYSDSPNVSDAVEGLGFIAEQKKDWDAALAYYREITDKWPTSFAAKRQPTNIARVDEARGDFKAALDAYREQVQVFPDSHLASSAQTAIDRLTKAHPEIAPAPVPAASSTAPTTESQSPESPVVTPKLNIKLPENLGPASAAPGVKPKAPIVPETIPAPNAPAETPQPPANPAPKPAEPPAPAAK